MRSSAFASGEWVEAVVGDDEEAVLGFARSSSSICIDHFDTNPKLPLTRAPLDGCRAAVLSEHACGVQRPGRAGGTSTRGAGQGMSVWEQLMGWWR